MEKLLVIVDMQKDFIDGSLANKDAKAIVPDLCEFIKEWDGDIVCTQDTHSDDYLNTQILGENSLTILYNKDNNEYQEIYKYTIKDTTSPLVYLQNSYSVSLGYKKDLAKAIAI